MSDKPKPKFWQLHLSTCFVAVLTATGAFALDIPSALLRSRPSFTNWMANLIATTVVTLPVAAFCEALARQRSSHRRRFQISLISMVVASLLFGLMLYANTLPRRTMERSEFRSYTEQRGKEQYEVWGKVIDYGWPMRACQCLANTVAYSPAGKQEVESHPNLRYFEFSWAPMAFNVVFGLIGVYLSVCGMEWLIRRREGRKP